MTPNDHRCEPTPLVIGQRPRFPAFAQEPASAQDETVDISALVQ